MACWTLKITISKTSKMLKIFFSVLRIFIACSRFFRVQFIMRMQITCKQFDLVMHNNVMFSKWIWSTLLGRQMICKWGDQTITVEHTQRWTLETCSKWNLLQFSTYHNNEPSEYQQAGIWFIKEHHLMRWESG